MVRPSGCERHISIRTNGCLHLGEINASQGVAWRKSIEVLDEATEAPRISTMVIYLNDVVSGGKTIFPEVRLSVSPKKGNAVYFEYCNTRSQVDYKSPHAGAPVAEGEK